MTKQTLLRSSALTRADEDKDEKDERDDADAGTLLKTAIADMAKVMDAVDKMADAFGKRMDALDGKLADACGRMDSWDEKKKSDSAKKDEDEKDENKSDEDKDEKDEKSDEDKDEGEAKDVVADKGKRKDEDDDKDEKHADADVTAMRAEIAELRRTLGAVQAAQPRAMNDADADALLAAQAYADEVYAELGMRAPGPLTNEDLTTYRRRLLKELKPFSAALKDANLYAISDDAGFAAIEQRIYSDALHHARSPASVPAGRLRSVTKRGESGHTITEHFGESSAWMLPMAGPVTSHVTEFDLG